jgi:hemoglobin-like flavoprotein
MAEALSDKTIEIVKSTVPALEAGGTAITDRMYQLMFRNAEVRALFNQSHHGETGSQSKALTAAIIAYARNIDNLGSAGQTGGKRVIPMATKVFAEFYRHSRSRAARETVSDHTTAKRSTAGRSPLDQTVES